MSPIVVPAAEILGDLSSNTRTLDDGSAVITVNFHAVDPTAEIRKLWVVVLLTAIRDHATSVHYHPWRSDGRLTYVIEGREYGFLPRPPDEHADAIIEAARALFTVPSAGRFLSRFVGRALERTVCSTFFVYGSEAVSSVLWDAVVWSNGERSGVELFRVTPLEPRNEPA